MANFRDFVLLFQAITNLEGIRADMRANAQTYLDAANVKTQTVAQIVAIISSDGAEYQRRLGWIQAIPAADKTSALAVASALGLDTNEITSAYTELKNMADQIVSTAPTYNNYTQITNGANFILNNIPAHYRLW